MVAILALLAGFAAREPSRPHLTQVQKPARGPLIQADDHPEWKQFLVQAAYRRADELERLRDLPASPMIVEEVVAAPVEDKVAALPSQSNPDVKEDFTGTIDDKSNGVMPIEIGEASSVELPLSEQEILPPVRQPESLQKLNDSQPKARAKTARLKSKPPAKPGAQPAVPDLVATVLGERLSVSP